MSGLKPFSSIVDAQTTELIANLKIAFKTLVDAADWMDSDTKAVAREKVDYMSEFVGYPDWILVKSELEAYYNGVFTLILR